MGASFLLEPRKKDKLRAIVKWQRRVSRRVAGDSSDTICATLDSACPIKKIPSRHFVARTSFF